MNTLKLLLFFFCWIGSKLLYAQERPNVVFFILDDAGYSDIGVCGSEIHTPNIDSLAKDGIQFQKFYNNARCSPTRATLLTGQYSHRVGVGELAGKEYHSDLLAYKGYLKKDNNVTIAELLRDAGYETMLSGKWHLGGASDFPESAASHPLRRGFNKFYGILGPSADYFKPQEHWDGFNRVPVSAGNNDQRWYSEDAFGDKAVEWIQQAVDASKPFYLHFAFKAPHNPRHSLEADYRPYLNRYPKSKWPSIIHDRYSRQIASGLIPPAWSPNTFEFDLEYYANMPQERANDLQEISAIKAGAIESADRNIGKVLRALEKHGLSNNTLIFFLSDNGSAVAHDLNTIWNTPFRGGKGDLTEGGMVSTGVIRWPAVIKKPRVVVRLAGIWDIMPTVLESAGVDYPKTYEGRNIKPLDGLSLMKLLANGDGTYLDRRTLFWELYGQKAVIRDNRWKYFVSFDQKTGATQAFLYDLKNDGTEMNNLIETVEYAELSAELNAAWQSWAAEVGVQPFNHVTRAKDQLRQSITTKSKTE